MKKLLLFTLMLSFANGCSRDDAAPPVEPVEDAGMEMPHVYGIAMPDRTAPETRGVAVTTKVWSKPIAEKNLTVKFLNGTERYRELVREAANEWERNAGVRFFFVGDTEDAMIRVGFDYVPGMMSSWAHTGSDHLQLYDRQSEPTVHFAQWRRASDALKRSDALRAFGQVLGLQLEFRHPKFHPNWITDANGNIDQERIREYWESELAGYIAWEELKKVVLDPISDPSFLVAKTTDYDPESVMNWPFYEMLANNIPPIEFDEDYKTELSDSDKAFIETLYGPSFNGMPLDDEYLPLAELECASEWLGINITTTEDLVIIWDKDARISERVEVTADATVFSTSYSHNYPNAAKRKIIVGQLLKPDLERLSSSTALTSLEFNGSGIGQVAVSDKNDALEKFLLKSGPDFTSQTFDFTNFKSLKELYLSGTLDSRVIVNNCPKLETLATSLYVWRPPYLSTGVISGGSRVVGIGWPINAEREYALSDKYGQGVTIKNCSNLRAISLENTRIKRLDFSNLPNLNYVYLSSAPEYLVGGGQSVDGDYLDEAAKTLPSRTGKTPGVVLLRSIGTMVLYGGFLGYESIEIPSAERSRINQTFASKNWTPYWDAPYWP